MIRYYCDLCDKHVESYEDLHNVTIEGFETKATMFDVCDCCYTALNTAITKALADIAAVNEVAF